MGRLWDWLVGNDSKEDEKVGKIYDDTGLGPLLKGGSSDNFYEKIEGILKDVVGGLGRTETRMNAYNMGDGQYQWLVHVVVPRKQVIADWQNLLALANDKKSLKEAEVAVYMEQFRGLSGIAANIHLLRKSGPAKECREAKEELEELCQNAADLESKVKELGTFGYWVQEFQGGKKYAVYPYPSVMEVQASSNEIRPSSLKVLLSPQLNEKDKKLFHGLGAKLGERIQQEYTWLDVHIGYAENTVLYTQPLSEVRGKTQAKKKPEKKPVEKKYW